MLTPRATGPPAGRPYLWAPLQTPKTPLKHVQSHLRRRRFPRFSKSPKSTDFFRLDSSNRVQSTCDGTGSLPRTVRPLRDAPPDASLPLRAIGSPADRPYLFRPNPLTAMPQADEGSSASRRARFTSRTALRSSQRYRLHVVVLTQQRPAQTVEHQRARQAQGRLESYTRLRRHAVMPVVAGIRRISRFAAAEGAGATVARRLLPALRLARPLVLDRLRRMLMGHDHDVEPVPLR